MLRNRNLGPAVNTPWGSRDLLLLFEDSNVHHNSLKLAQDLVSSEDQFVPKVLHFHCHKSLIGFLGKYHGQ